MVIVAIIKMISCKMGWKWKRLFTRSWRNESECCILKWLQMMSSLWYLARYCYRYSVASARPSVCLSVIFHTDHRRLNGSIYRQFDLCCAPHDRVTFLIVWGQLAKFRSRPTEFRVHPVRQSDVAASVNSDNLINTPR